MLASIGSRYNTPQVAHSPETELFMPATCNSALMLCNIGRTLAAVMCRVTAKVVSNRRNHLRDRPDKGAERPAAPSPL